MVNIKNQSIKLLLFSVAISCLLFISYANNLKWLWSRWMENPSYSHGPLIPLISFFIVFQKRKQLKQVEINGSNMGALVLLSAILLYVVSLRAQINFTMSYSLMIFLIGFVLLIYGKEMLAILAFPILFLSFMVPFWGEAIIILSNWLKTLSSVLTFQIMKSLGYTIFRDGVILHLTNGSLEVADPCSGIRSLIALLALGTLVAYYSRATMIKKMVLVLLAIPLTLLGNTLRVVFIGLMLEKKAIMITEGPLHTLTGVAVFIFALVFLLGFSKWISRS